MHVLGKFRTFASRIPLRSALSVWLAEKVQRLGGHIESVFIEKLLDRMSNELEKDMQYEIEAAFDGVDLLITKKHLSAENESEEAVDLQYSNDSAPEKFANLFWVKQDGCVYCFEGLLNDLLAIYVADRLTQKMPLKCLSWDLSELHDSFDGAEEAFSVSFMGGVQSYKAIGDHAVGASKFCAAYLRQVLRELE